MLCSPNHRIGYLKSILQKKLPPTNLDFNRLGFLFCFPLEQCPWGEHFRDPPPTQQELTLNQKGMKFHQSTGDELEKGGRGHQACVVSWRETQQENRNLLVLGSCLSLSCSLASITPAGCGILDPSLPREPRSSVSCRTEILRLLPWQAASIWEANHVSVSSKVIPTYTNNT